MNTEIRVFIMFLLLPAIRPLQALAGYEGSITVDMPVYRYYDRLPDSYSPAVVQPSEDVNSYWADRYYGNQSPDERELFRLDLEIFNLEQREMNVSETMARSS